ncbi:MAG: thioredoxin family protein [Bulleidia sp.]|nr:thioredoxin family protein [Bulleidia sp.]
MKKNHIVTAALFAAVITLTGCGSSSAASIAETTAAASAEASAAPTADMTAEHEKFAGEYTGVAAWNAFSYGTQDDILAMLKHGTGIVYLGFPSCPFCQAYVPMLNDAAMKNNVPVIYYDIKQDREDNSEFYQEVVSILGDNLDYDADGKPRIYVPDVSFVIKGEIIGHDNESSMLSSKETSPEEYWTEEKKQALSTKLNDLAAQVSEARSAVEDQGCDTSCEFTAGD